MNETYPESSEEIKLKMDPDPKIIAALEMIDEDYLREILTVLSVQIGPRKTGTYGCEEAAKYLYEEFENMGIKTRYQHWTSWTKKLKFFKSKNIEATVPGNGELSDEVIVFNAHYDTVTVSPGAIDDGSGVAAVVAAANALSHFDFFPSSRNTRYSLASHFGQ